MTIDDDKGEELRETETFPADTLPSEQADFAPTSEPASEADEGNLFLTTDGEMVAEAAPDGYQPDRAKTEPIWAKIRQFILGESYRLDDPVFNERLSRLAHAIERAPDDPDNYVLRGEIYLRAKVYELARDDFQRGAELADAAFESSDWGLLAQATRDRALIGLAKAEKKLSL